MSAVVSKWLLGLSQVTSSAEPISREKIAAMAALIGKDFPDAAFTLDSLGVVAACSPYWPAYAELSKRLGDWWRENRPPEQLILCDGRMDELTAEDKAWLAYWRANQRSRLIEEHQLMASAVCRVSPEQLPVAKLASLVRENSPRAWEIILADEMVSP